MEFDLSWVLLGFPFVFALGWWASRIDWRQWRLENSQAPRAYFKGLNFLLNEQQDQAIDAFIEAVQKDPETSDLHFALGSLFRRRGEFDRAIRVHEHLLSRADLPRDDRERARHELALDFMKAGLYDRAEAAWAGLERTAYAQEAALGQLVICERWHDWPRAAALAQKLLAGQGQMPLTHDLARNLAHNLAHYLCEQAAAAQEPGEKLALLEQAQARAPDAARPRVERARLLAAQGQPQAALQALAELPAHAPQALPLVACEMVALAAQCQALPQTRALLEQSYAQAPALDVAEALAQACRASGTSDTGDASQQQARQIYVRHLEQTPSLNAAARWLAGAPIAPPETHAAVQRAVERAARPLACYRCAACGFTAKTHLWQCPGCQAWDTMPPRRVEELDQ